ncbi:hypothetical protein HK098_002611 [Nowakowskiella sp. JEL0407]|nr:hypothetical protein HK098_002611 [Nowakowskiella sp. JEL0407]
MDPSSLKQPSFQTPLNMGAPIPMSFFQTPLQTRSLEEIKHNHTVNQRITAKLSEDLKSTRQIDTSAFKSNEDFLSRLIPYHVWQYPAEDLEFLTKKKRKAIEDANSETKKKEKLERAQKIYSKYRTFQINNEKTKKELDGKMAEFIVELMDPPPPPIIPMPVMPMPTMMIPMPQTPTPQGNTIPLPSAPSSSTLNIGDPEKLDIV